MIRKKSFSVNKINFFAKDMNFIFESLKKYPYSEEKGYGVSDIEIEENTVSALLIKRVSTFISDYNIVKGIIEKKQIFLYSEIRFFIDFEYHLLYALGPSLNLAQVKILFRTIFANQYEVSMMELTPYKTYKVLKQRKLKFEIDAICIDRFNFKDGALGKYSAKISDKTVGVELIRLYKEDVSKIVFSFSFQNSDFKIHLYTNNIISIISEQEDLDTNFNLFKKFIF